ncbi:MAG: outer membrane beta-barrel protein [Opitutales bacterium]|jgi:opacity protein-like surface antigen
MKKRFFCIVSLLSMCCAQSLCAELYLRGSAMYAQPQDLTGSSSFRAAMNSSAAFTVALGYKLTILRVEGEAMMLRNSVDEVSGAGSFIGKGTLKNSNVFINAYVDIPGIPIITPYVGVGAGLGWVDFDGDFEFTDMDHVSFSERSTLPGYQAILGVRARIPGTGISAYANYRYLHMNGMRVNASEDDVPSLSSGDTSMWELGMMISL